jgi:hypothetical protein
MSDSQTSKLSSSGGESAQNLRLENPSKRAEYLTLIDRLLETSFQKAQSKYCKNSERISWIRAITGLVMAGSAVLKDEDLDSIEKRLEALENLRGPEVKK